MGIDFDKYKIAFGNLPSGVSEVEINLEKKEGTLIEVEKGKVSKSGSYNKAELHLRASGYKTGYTYTEQLNEEPIILINKAIENSKIIEGARLEKMNAPGELEAHFKVNSSDKLKTQYELDTQGVLNTACGLCIGKEGASLPGENNSDENGIKENDIIENEIKENNINEKMLNVAIELEKLLLNCDKRIKKHASCSIRSDFRNNYVLNSLGLNLASRSNFFRTEITAIIEEAGEQYDYTTFSMANSLEELKPKEMAEKAAFMAALKINATQPQSGKYNILISNEVALKMMLTLWQLFSASNVITGKSILKDMLNKKIGSSALNIIDSPTHPLSGYNFEFDCEGTKAKEKSLIYNGILKNILSNNSLAADIGMDSSGNAGWCDTMGNIYPSQLTVTPMNIYIHPGNKSEGTIMADMKEGIYVAYVGDYYHSIDITSGNISMPCGGALIKKGKLSQNVKQMTLSCNILDLFNNLKEVGNDLIFDEFDKRSYCIGSPCLLISDVYISSK